MKPKLRTDDHKGISNVVLSIAHEHKLLALDSLGKVVLEREHIGDHLRWMELIGQAVPDRDARMSSEVLDDFLPVTTVLDAVEHAAKHACSVFNRFLFPHLGATRIEIGYA